MKLSDFDYQLPKQLIAQKPISPRDSSRLMVLNRKLKKIEHKHFYDIAGYLTKGDILVLNNTKVFPARLIGRRKNTGGKVEVFLLKITKSKIKRTKQEPKLKIKKEEFWEALIGNRRKKIGQIIEFGRGLKCEIVKQIDEAVWLVRFNKSGNVLEKSIDKLGQVPTPPYIKIQDTCLPAGTATNPSTGSRAYRQETNKSQIQNFKFQKLKNDYQTVYAKYRGSVAAPTAGFHFTKPLINKLKKQGVQFEYITLHVGFGTFEPVKVSNIKNHTMHSEFAVIDSQTAIRLNQAKKEGRRIIAVGTTTVRVLEAFSQEFQDTRNKQSAFAEASSSAKATADRPADRQETNKSQKSNYKLKAQKKWVNIFIYPGYQFKFVDTLITNFHLPKSTLLMLVSAFASASANATADKKAPADKSAFAGHQFVFKAYQSAVRKKYRFYSFGDSMFVV
ncbi:S-adenosylmethionine:tRNA ribosyltransferase-isomerase [Patescibacteria group bacterium]|nr:S-adenosylmethionine:tRNA ribosyltransferase-isomerase [Patescibacteria group bacterium]